MNLYFRENINSLQKQKVTVVALTIYNIEELITFKYLKQQQLLVGTRGSVRLSRHQSMFFGVLSDNIGKLVTRSRVMDILYSDSLDPPFERVLDVYVCHIRDKLTQVGAYAEIETVYGTGWVFKLCPQN
jgi:DNA-binding response OmpR family regulator